MSFVQLGVNIDHVATVRQARRTYEPDPVWAATQAAGLSISFHIGSGDISDIANDSAGMGTKANFSRGGSLALLDNQNCLANLLFGGVCARFPELDFVSVESGVGWLQCVLEMFDWQWTNGDVAKEHPDYDPATLGQHLHQMDMFMDLKPGKTQRFASQVGLGHARRLHIRLLQPKIDI